MEKKIQGSKVNGKFVGASETWLLRHHIYAPTDGIRIMEHFFTLVLGLDLDGQMFLI